MNEQTSLAALLQIADSAFPAGGFTHSSGLEMLVRDGRITDAAGVESYVFSLIRYSISTGDAVAAAIAARASADADLELVARTDHSLFATKAPSELRDASTTMGLRLLQEVAVHLDEPLFDRLLASVRGGETPGTYAVVFGAIGGALGATPEQVATALMHVTATSTLQASMRLLPISHRDVQRTLHALRPVVAQAAIEAAATSLDDLRSFHPLEEIASMRHRSADMRMFAS